MDVNLLFKDINIDNEGNITFIKLDGTQYQDSLDVYTQLDMNSISSEYLLIGLDDNFILNNSYKEGTLAFFNNGNSYKKVETGWELMYRFSNADINLSLDSFDSNKNYNEFDVFYFNGIKYYSSVTDSQIDFTSNLNVNFLNSETVLEVPKPVELFSVDRFFLHYANKLSYTVYDMLASEFTTTVKTRQSMLLSNESSIYLKDSSLYYNNTELVNDVICYCKYGNYVYTVDSNNIISKRRIGDLTKVLEEILIVASIQVTSETVLSYGSESFTFYNSQTSSLSILHGGDITTVVIPSSISMVNIGDRGFIYFYNDSTQKIEKLSIFTQAIPFHSDLILNSDKEPNDNIISVELDEISTSNIDNYLNIYDVEFKDITIDGSGIIFGIGYDNFIYKIIPTSGSVFSIDNSIIKSNFEISDMQSISIINNKLYITQTSSLIVRQIDKELLNINGVAFNMESIGSSYIQSIAEGISGDIGILTDTGVLRVYETLISQPSVEHQLVNYTSLTKVIPADSKSFFATQLRDYDNTIYKVFYDNVLENPTINVNGPYTQLFTLSKSYVGLTIDKSELGRLHALNVKTDLDNI